jgi:hypothetical protein
MDRRRMRMILIRGKELGWKMIVKGYDDLDD